MNREHSDSTRWLAAAAFVVFLSAFIATINPTTTPAQVADPSPLLDQTDTNTLVSHLETAIPQLMQKGRVPGLQVAVIREGKIIWNKGFGIKNAESNDPVTDQTIFEAASLTKPLFAYAVMMLAQEGVLDLDTPLISHFSNEEMEGFLGHPIDKEGFHREWIDVITPRQVLSHSAGTPHGEGGEVYPLFFEPGSQYKYSAAGYYWLQMAVVKLTGEPLETTIQKRVLDPLGMTHSCLIWRDAYENAVANGHNMFGRPQAFRRYTEPHAAASLYTTAADYARFVCAVLNGEGLEGETLKEMLSPQVVVDEDLGLSWSLGFGIQKDANGAAFWQWGDYGIFRNYILAYPEQKIGVVYLTNSFLGLGICHELISETIGGQALGMTFLNYRQYDSPIPIFTWAVQDRGLEAVEELLPKMKEEHPDEFTAGIIGWLGREFNEAGMTEEGIAILEFNVEEDPQSPGAHASLARAYLDQGDRETARRYYEKTLVLAEEEADAREAGADEAADEAADGDSDGDSDEDSDEDEAFDTSPIEWAMEYIDAFDNPVAVPAEHLQKLAGDYDARHFELRDGGLWYLRDGTARTEFTKLTPMSDDMFVMEGVVYFRLQFEYDEQGRPTKVVGLYDSGYRDESMRDE
jgi:CubicO group peptidase (beta-lactamase class C family)